MSTERRGGQSSQARGRRMATKGRPRPASAEADQGPSQDDIGVEARVVAGILLNAALEKRNGLTKRCLSLPHARWSRWTAPSPGPWPWRPCAVWARSTRSWIAA